MTLKEAKKKAAADGSVKIAAGTWLETGACVLKETLAIREGDDINFIADGYTAADIIADELYIVTDSGYFSCPMDTEIAAILEQAKEVSHAAATLGRKGGAAKSDAKAAASRENGKKGGRPRKEAGK